MKPYLRPIFLLFLILLDQSISASAAININGLRNKIREVLNKHPSINLPADKLKKVKRPLKALDYLLGECKDRPPQEFQEFCPKFKNDYQQNCPNAAYEAVCPLLKQAIQICCQKHA
ncbi:hypothetical protein AAZX31_02G026700 [Glycine max]|uniref:Uncharacterized protein n=1 Tax=Glycine max TaxID=3847 RepID=C6TFW0_SOYBN|nr:unknown [Glycine max]KRH69455.1 hypothetical protein GLYMA_02G028400v4 [Glycine max]